MAGADNINEPSMTEEELGLLIDEVQQEGTLEKSEGELVKSAMQFDEIRVSEICIPRVDVVAVSVTASAASVRQLFIDSEFSRIPVYEGSIDHIIGAVFLKDFFMKYSPDKKNFRITDILRPVKFVPENANIANVMNDMQKAKIQMAVVLDGYGGTVGIVTMEDILEELVGDIWDECDIVKCPVVKEADGTYTALGDADLVEVMERMDQKYDLKSIEGVSVGGYIFNIAEHIPKVGDEVRVGDVRMIVKSFRNRRINEVTCVIDPVKEDEGSQKS